MTLQEAIKSGKRFRRPNMFTHDWYDNPSDHGSFDYIDILADDWELEVKKVEITADQLLDALTYATTATYAGKNGCGPVIHVADLMKRLGL